MAKITDLMGGWGSFCAPEFVLGYVRFKRTKVAKQRPDPDGLGQIMTNYGKPNFLSKIGLYLGG